MQRPPRAVSKSEPSQKPDPASNSQTTSTLKMQQDKAESLVSTLAATPPVVSAESTAVKTTEIVSAASQNLIQHRLHEGQRILVQVTKDQLGSKGARLTTNISLPSRYLVYLPSSDHIGISQRIDGEEERSRSKD